VTTFIGLYVTVGCLVGIVAPSKLDDINTLFNWSNLCLGAFWTIFTTNGILSFSLSSQQNKAAPMRWGLNIGSLAYFLGGIAVVGLFDGNNANWPPMTASVRWILFNAAIVAPLCLLGLTTQSSFLLVLTATGVLLDAFRLCHVWTRSYQDDTLVALVYFLVLGGTGILTAILGWWLSRQQQALAARLSSYVAPYAWFPARWHESTTPMFTALPTGDFQQEAPPTAAADDETTQR
jgi:NADH:ubiquinone oxidoreductase subunit K